MAATQKFLEVKSTSTEIEATFGNGRTVRVYLDDLPMHIMHQAAILGLTNKVRDTAANFSKTNDYDGAYDAMRATVQSLIDGEWSRTGGGVAGQKMKDLATAIAETQKASFEKAFAVVEKASKEQRAKWAKNAAIAAIMARLEADRLQAKAATAEDADGLPTFDMDASDDESISE